MRFWELKTRILQLEGFQTSLTRLLHFSAPFFFVAKIHFSAPYCIYNYLPTSASSSIIFCQHCETISSTFKQLNQKFDNPKKEKLDKKISRRHIIIKEAIGPTRRQHNRALFFVRSLLYTKKKKNYIRFIAYQKLLISYLQKLKPSCLSKQVYKYQND